MDLEKWYYYFLIKQKKIPPTNAHLLALEQQSAVKERRSATKVTKYRRDTLIDSNHT